MLAGPQLEEIKKLFSADSPATNWAREEISERIADMLDLSGIDMSEKSTEEIGLEAKARKLAAEKARELFDHLGFDLLGSARKDRSKSFR